MFKKGDKIRCIDDSGSEYTTVGKIYTVIESDYAGTTFLDDRGERGWVYNRRFELVNKKAEELALRTIDWSNKMTSAIKQAGGDPEVILEKLSDELKVILILNNLYLTYGGPK